VAQRSEPTRSSGERTQSREPTRLSRGDLHVWVVALEDDEPAARRRLANEALKSILAGYLHLAPGAIELERGPYGKPRLLGEPLRFNLSHSERVALVAVSAELEVGVDVQAPHRATAAPWFARRVCTQRERQALGRPPDPDELLRLWVRKEALVKARGTGSFLDAGRLDVLEDELPDGYVCRDLELPRPAGYRAAVAFASPPAPQLKPEPALLSFRWS